ncbi:hypothetical protein HK101_008897 [Irineochytrium annulatum]|nr:hypothetical protein HK101_008897 [Irineochytrium annulatum]
MQPHIIVAVIALLLAVVSADVVTFDNEQQARWNTLRQYGVTVTNSLCSNDIVDTLDEANFVYVNSGISEEFMHALYNVRDVSGDIPDAGIFRSQLLVAFNDFASTINFAGSLTNTTSFSVSKVMGVGKPVFYGHKSAHAFGNRVHKGFLYRPTHHLNMAAEDLAEKLSGLALRSPASDDTPSTTSAATSTAPATSSAREKPMPPPISVTSLGGSASSSSSSLSEVPETPIITSRENALATEDLRPSVETVRKRRGGVCITEPK